ncbi:rhodanese-like domain-containing protein [Thermobifida alba]|uniref:Rhodanese-like domain-containing protein n=1 Tax=Thermobifida alba TaxID=53522 RepID=A0ABY4L7N5_THEAE|nr:rhodanese-like domain-containing protein [Thermobifida alba]UPT22415.1 rhodanese-like domain-containing protein [Thermobifida alba]HLU98030.1 rhodanese-like domain-containing protein [Thermobifida alba]
MDSPISASLTPEQVRELQERNPRTRVIDVRTPGEFAGMHIPGSYNVPLDLLREHRRELSAEHDDPVVLVCRSGMRADQARALVEGSGLERISVLRGGISEWERTGAPLNRGAGGRWAMERQVRLVAGSIVLASVAASAVFGPLKWVAAAVGAGLTFAAVTDSCLMARLLALLPYNRADSCDAPAMLTALTDAAPAARD